MPNHIYRVIELAGSSETSHADAIKNAIARASKRPVICAGSK